MKKKDENDLYPINHEGNYKNLILLCLTIYKDVNIELVRNIKKYIAKKDVKLLVKSHPLKSLNKQYLLNSNDNFIDVSDKTFKEIYQKYCGPNVRAVAISNQSTSLCKSLNFNFMPIWLSFIGEAPILCSELLDNVGKFVKNSDNLRLILDSYFHNQNFKEEILKQKIKSEIYIDKTLYESDVESLIKNLSLKNNYSKKVI